jgi:hypothetical protein
MHWNILTNRYCSVEQPYVMLPVTYYIMGIQRVSYYVNLNASY